MATAAEPSKIVATPKYEAFVEQQLTRARQRIRILDMAAAGLGLLVLVLLYAVGMAVLDHWLTLSLGVRQLALLGLVALMIAYVAVTFIRPLSRQVNPYYAARQVEQTLPEAKNSLVNWLDLRLQKLSPAIRQAVGHRAAHDLTQADLDTAINGRRVAWLGGVAGLLLLAAVILLCILHFDPFRSLLGRAFAPFGDASKAHRTRITIMQPDGGDATVPVNQSVSITVQVDGVVPEPNKPDALKLLFHYNQNDPAYEELRLERGDHGREWVARVPDFQIHDGFWYKVIGGDDETAEYRIQVRATPLLTDFDVTYHFRPYLRRLDAVTSDPNLQGLRGTQVTIVAHTNRKVKEGRLLLDNANQPMPAELAADQPDALKFRLVLEKPGSYRIRFTSTEGEENAEPIPYTIQVEQDHPPQVVLTKPGKNIELPADGVLSVEGKAEDDYGLASVTLKMQVGQQELAGKLYRGKEWWDRFKDAFLPQSLDYKDFVELDKVQSKTGEPFTLQPGTELEYWLEAADACDYPPPGPQVGRSEHFKVKILPPRNKPEQKKQEKEKAQQEQKQHEQKQDQQLNKQQEQQARNEQNKQPETKPQDPQKQEQEKKDDHTRQEAKQMQEKIKEQQKEQPGQKENNPNEQKGNPDQKKPSNSDSKESKAEQRPQPQQDGNQNKGEGKPDSAPKPGEKKPDAKPQGGGQAGEKKSQPKQDPGEGKKGGQPGPAPEKGDKKPDGQPEKDGQPGEKKPQPASPQSDNKSAGEKKPQPQPNNSPDDNKAAAGKPEPSQQDPKQPPGQGKPEGQPEGNPSKGEGKGGNNPGGGNTPNQGQSPGASKEQTPAGEPKKNDNKDGGTAGQPQPGEPKKEGQQSQGGGQPKAEKKTDGQQQSSDSAKPGQLKGDNEKPPTPSQSDAPEPGTPKNGPDANPQQSPGDGKKEGAETTTDKGDGKGQGSKEQGQGASGEPKKQPDKKGEQTGEAKAPAKGQKDNGTQPGVPGSGNRTTDAVGVPSPEEGDAANPAYRKKAFELQLEDLKKKLTPDMLKKLNMTEKERDEFLKACEEALKRMPSEPRKKEPLPGAQTGRGGPNTGPRRIDPNAKGPRDDLENAGPTTAPPEYRNAYKEFTEELAKRKKDRERK